MAPPHVVAFPFPTQGHTNPMVLFCRKLASMGFVITFINTRTRHEQEFKQTGPAGDDSFRFVSIPDDCIPKFEANGLELFLKAMGNMKPDLEEILMELMKDVHRPPVSCILFDAFIGWGQEICDKLKVGRAMLWTPSAACLSLHFNLHLIRNILPAKGRKELIDFIPGLPPFYPSQLPSSLQKEDENDRGFEHRFRRMETLKADTWVFVNTFEELEAAPMAAAREINPKCLSVGPLHYSVAETQLAAEWAEDTSCLEWLDKQKPHSVIYVSFGSAATISFRDAQRIFEGLDASGHAFLWVIRLDLLKGSDEEIKELTTEIKRNEKALVISWAPQIKVLEHESVGAFFSHCGWNSTIESISAGVPMLCLPCFAEQALNCVWIVDKLEIGVRAKEGIDQEEVHASYIQKMVQLLLEDEGLGTEMRSRAKTLSDTAKRSVQRNGSSHSSLVQFAAALATH